MIGHDVNENEVKIAVPFDDGYGDSMCLIGTAAAIEFVDVDEDIEVAVGDVQVDGDDDEYEGPLQNSSDDDALGPLV